MASVALFPDYRALAPQAQASLQRKPDPLKPVQKTAFADGPLAQAILWCELAPGIMVTEAMLAVHFDLDRAATRVARADVA